MRHVKNWDPVTTMFNWAGSTAVIVAFIAVWLMSMWQGI